MQNKEQNALLLHRENYCVPKGQEQVVHYKIAKFNSAGGVVEPARLVHDEPKIFDSLLKRNLEIMGYTVEILYHPNGKYSDVKIETANEQIIRKDEEIARLKAELAKAKGTPTAEPKAEPTAETTETPEPKAEPKREPKKVIRKKEGK